MVPVENKNIVLVRSTFAITKNFLFILFLTILVQVMKKIKTKI